MPKDDRLWRASHGESPFDEERDRAALRDDDGDEYDDAFDDDEEDLDELVDSARAVLAERGPLTPEELAEHLGADLGDIDEVQRDGLVAVLGDHRLASVAALLAATVLTHRLSGDEAASGVLRLGADLAPVKALVCDLNHIHLADGAVASVTGDRVDADVGSDAWLEGPKGWLGGAGPGDVVGFRLVAAGPSGDPALEVVPIPEEAGRPEPIGSERGAQLGAQLRASFHHFGEGDAMPVRVDELLYQLAVDAPAEVAGVMAPLSEVLDGAAFEVRGAYTAPLGADWERFGQLQTLVAAGLRHGLDKDGIHALALACGLCDLFGRGDLDRLDRDLAHAGGELFTDPDVAEAFAEATADRPETAMALLARVRAGSGHRYEAALAWGESLVAGRAGDLERAEACLRAAVAADPENQPALEDAAWYASDRGDAQRALRLLERLEVDPDEPRTEMLRRYAGGASPARAAGRNDPCPCGSGRKFKHCCLHAPAAPLTHPLPERVRWLWEKLRWWLDRAGPAEAVDEAMFALHGPPVDHEDDVGINVDFDITASLVLFADGAVHDFLRQRGRLLPDDERNLVAQWSLTERSLHEVADCHPGVGVTLRDLRTGDTVAVNERKGSTVLAAGDLILAHPVFDGAGFQFIGGIVPVPLAFRDPLLGLLDEGAGSFELAMAAGRTRLPPVVLNMEGEPTVLCQATYELADRARAASQLGSVLESSGEDCWVEWVEVDGERWARGQVSVEGDRLTLSANSEARFDRLQDLLARAVPGLELVAEERTPAAEAFRRLRPPGSSSPSADEMPPEATEALAVVIRERETRWLDENIPALAGLTPRQAAADPTRREDLVALLHEFDQMAPPPGVVSFDTGRLRKMLGLAGP